MKEIETVILRCYGCETHTMHEVIEDEPHPEGAYCVCLECGEER